MEAEDTITINGSSQKDSETKWNYKRRSKDSFLMFCEIVLQHERELLSETLNSSQETINENRAPEGRSVESIENSTFNSDSDGGANGEIATYTNEGGGGGEDGDSFNSVTCFCGKPFAGRPMIECSGCLTWLHMSCAKVKRKNIPEFYYCDGCKNNELLSPTSNMMGTSTASSGDEGSTAPRISRNIQNGTFSSNSIPTEGLFMVQQNLNKHRKPKMMKKNASLMMSSSDNIKNNASDSKFLANNKSSPTSVNGKLKKMRQKMSPTTKKMRQGNLSPTKSTKAYASSSLAAAASLTELSLNHQASAISNGAIDILATNLLKFPIATNNNNNIYNIIETSNIIESENVENKSLKLL